MVFRPLAARRATRGYDGPEGPASPSTSARPPLSILLLTVLGFCVLYAPQPLLPLLAGTFSRSPADASLLITVTLLPLAIAPLGYGYLLEGVPARRMMVAATTSLAICQAGMALVGEWWSLLVLRAIEGLTLPALLTALMTFVAGGATRPSVRQALAWYVSATIVGGFLGRALSGLVATHSDWRVAMGVWAPLLVITALSAQRLPITDRNHYAKISPRVFREVLGFPGLPYAYLAILCVFFIFAGLLNLLPFRLTALDPTVSATGIGMAYAGYLSGVAASLGAQPIRRRLRSEGQALGLGLAVYGGGLLLFAPASLAGHTLAMFLLCAGMFLVHTRLSGQVNQLTTRHRGVVNGVYIAAYYLGGSLGTWLPAMLYRQWGWEVCLAGFGTALVLAAWCVARFVRIARLD